MARKPARVSLDHHKWVVPEAHGLAREVRPERVLEARMDDGPRWVPPKWVQFGFGIVDPRPSDLVVALEDHHLVALPPQLSRGD
ncbi:hypothetical protein Sjap_020427 [Stephania japonica]|uniref:Uncharacterized protein n=1 Tax=Stephania japonica TaxID=461633 RepID=A0AAP0F5Y5_9MAGN